MRLHRNQRMFRLPRLSLKSVFLVIGIFGAYLACWKITIDYGVADVEGTYEEPNSPTDSMNVPVHTYESAWSPVPFLVATNDYSAPDSWTIVPWRRVHYFWTPWFVVRLPFAYDVRVPSMEVMSQRPHTVLARCASCKTPILTRDPQGAEHWFGDPDRCVVCGHAVERTSAQQ